MSALHSLTIPIDGRLLIAHLAAYGLGAALDAAGEDAFIVHDASLELTPQVLTPVSCERVATCIRGAADACEEPLEADLEPGRTGNDRRAAIWTRATAIDRAAAALRERERILEELEQRQAVVAVALIVALGAPACWLGDHPDRGATRLDGVMGNYTSDFVRSVLRRTRAAAAGVDAEHLASLLEAGRHASVDGDRTGWAPSGTHVDLVCQWLAALGLMLLPVGLSAEGPARTPCHSAGGRRQAAMTLPVLDEPASVPRVRALLQAPELTYPELTPRDVGRLRALGINEILRFRVQDRSTPQSVAFSFRRAEYERLTHDAPATMAQRGIGGERAA